MAAPAAKVTQVGSTFKRDMAGQGLGHGQFMAESAAVAHVLGLFHLWQNYFRRRAAFVAWE
jgi:hypothetical protein